jgi:hypothetical protein
MMSELGMRVKREGKEEQGLLIGQGTDDIRNRLDRLDAHSSYKTSKTADGHSGNDRHSGGNA